MSRRPASLALAGLALLGALQASAQGLVDPTRPPNAPAGEADAAQSGTQLQSILIASNRRVAVINGAPVGLGGMVGEAKVIRINETEVTLQKGDEIEVLKLYPGVEKQPIKRRARGAVASQRSPQPGGIK
ncbi:MAG TPA: MSHA biogenesis protein MshK [Burkholderiales bacterium]|nr:MSHA biogenesis protein MshK [Burkholderiales bacterium]